MERWGERMMKVHSTWLANSISCCFPRLQDQPVEEKDVGYDEEPWTPSPTSSKRNSPLPVSSMAFLDLRGILKVLTWSRIQYNDHNLFTTSSSKPTCTS